MSMPRNAFDLNSIKSGDAQAIIISFKDGATKEMISLKDRKAVFSIKRSDNDPDDKSVIRKEFNFTTDEDTVYIELTTEDTEKLKGTYWCDFRLTASNSNQIEITLGPSQIVFVNTVTKYI